MTKALFFWRKAIIFAIAATALQFGIYGFTTVRSPNESPRELCKSILASRVDVVLFGDSTNRWTAAADMNRKSISSMFAELLPSAQCRTIDHEAYHLGVYTAYADRLTSEPLENPLTLVVPINIRSFSTSWYRRPGFRFYTTIQELNASSLELPFLRVARVFGAGKEITRKMFMALPLTDGNRQIGLVEDFERHFKTSKPTDEQIRQIIRYQYMEPVAASHPLLAELQKLVSFRNRGNVTLIFYITPVDYLYCRKIAGAEVEGRIGSNVQVVRKLLSEAGVTYVDLSNSLPSDCFSWVRYPNEHLNEKGRAFVAERIRSMTGSGHK